MNKMKIVHSVMPQKRNIVAGAREGEENVFRKRSIAIPKNPMPNGTDAVDSVLYSPKILPCMELGVVSWMIVFSMTTMIAIVTPMTKINVSFRRV